MIFRFVLLSFSFLSYIYRVFFSLFVYHLYLSLFSHFSFNSNAIYAKVVRYPSNCQIPDYHCKKYLSFHFASDDVDDFDDGGGGYDENDNYGEDVEADDSNVKDDDDECGDDDNDDDYKICFRCFLYTANIEFMTLLTLNATTVGLLRWGYNLFFNASLIQLLE